MARKSRSIAIQWIDTTQNLLGYPLDRDLSNELCYLIHCVNGTVGYCEAFEQEVRSWIPGSRILASTSFHSVHRRPQASQWNYFYELSTLVKVALLYFIQWIRSTKTLELHYAIGSLDNAIQDFLFA